MDELSRLQALAVNTLCPDCGEKRLDFKLRCEVGFGECLYTADCGGCGTTLQITRPEGATDEERRCARCGAARLHQTLVCESASQTCHEVYQCTDCGEVAAQTLLV
jgi:DNA-directed RNA polymerase subunit RPC12/RpoP